MLFIIIYVSIAVVWAIICAIARTFFDPDWSTDREKRKLCSQLLILSPVWPAALVWLLGRLFITAYEESGFDDIVKRWKK